MNNSFNLVQQLYLIFCYKICQGYRIGEGVVWGHVRNWKEQYTNERPHIDSKLTATVDCSVLHKQGEFDKGQMVKGSST